MRKDLYIDADSILYTGAAACQESYIITTHKDTGIEKEYPSKTHFYTWLDQQKDDHKNNYIIQTFYRPSAKKEVAYGIIDSKIEQIKKKVRPASTIICLEGEGNYRKDYDAKYIDYKSNRPPKPIFYQDCHSYMCERYKSILAEGQETDDIISIKAWESYNIAKETRNKKDAPYVIAYIDKDIVANARGLFINYNNIEGGISWINETYQNYYYWLMAMTGDSVDSIDGLYRVGDKTARKQLQGCKTEKELAEATIALYKQKRHDDWFDYLHENLFFLHLRRYEGEIFSLDKCLDNLGIEYE